jgi:hypothetical protein
MSIILRTHATGETRVISFEDFKERVRAGEIFPKDQVQDRVLTNNQWWTVDNLRLFHRLCPIHYTKGPFLVAREKAEEEQDRLQEISQTQAEKEAALARTFFREDPSESDIIPVTAFQFLTACHEEPLETLDFAARFTYMPFFYTPLFVRASRVGAEWELRYRAGLVSKTGRSPLASENGQRVLDLTEAASRAAIPRYDNEVGLDGAIWVLEISRQGAYQFHHRWSATCGMNQRRLVEFVGLCKYLVELSHLPQSTDEMC